MCETARCLKKTHAIYLGIFRTPKLSIMYDVPNYITITLSVCLLP